MVAALGLLIAPRQPGNRIGLLLPPLVAAAVRDDLAVAVHQALMPAHVSVWIREAKRLLGTRAVRLTANHAVKGA